MPEYHVCEYRDLAPDRDVNLFVDRYKFLVGAPV